VPNIFRKNQAKGTGIRGPRSNKSSEPKIPVGFTRSKTLSKRDAAFAMNKMGLTDVDGALRICIQRKLGGVGDILMSTATVHAIRQQYPNSEITYATAPNLFRVVENNPDIDVIADFKKIDPGLYDYFVDITSVCPPHEAKHKPPINRIDLFAKHVGIGLKSKVPVYEPTVDEVEWARTWLDNKWGDRDKYKLVFLSVSSFDSRRTWPVEKTIQLISEITALRSDVRFFVDDFNGRGTQWNQLNTLSERFAFRPMAALLNDCDLFVGPDSGPLHLAGALNKSIVSIFGPTDPAARINHYDSAVAVTAELGCQHCWYAKCNYDHACLKRLEVSSVQTAVLKKLDNKLPVDLNRIVINGTGPIARGIAAAIRLLDCKVAVGAPVEADDLAIDIIRTSSPPKNSLSFLNGKSRAAYVIVDSKISKSLILILAKYYDFILTNKNSSAQILRGISPSKPVSVVTPPLVGDYKPDRSLYFVENGDEVALLQAVADGIAVVVGVDTETSIPDRYLTRTEKPTSFANQLASDDDLINAQFAVGWLSKSAWLKSAHTILNMFYQRVENA